MNGDASALPCYVIPVSATEWHLLVRAVPGAKKSECAGEHEGRLRIRIAAPAVENKANKALQEFVAKKLGIRPSKVTVISGDTGRTKKLSITSDAPLNWSCLT